MPALDRRYIHERPALGLGAYIPPPVLSVPVQSGDITLKQVGIYAQDELSMGSFRATAGLRWDKAKQTGTQYDAPAAFDETELTGHAETAPQIGQTYATEAAARTCMNSRLLRLMISSCLCSSA